MITQNIIPEYCMAFILTSTQIESVSKTLQQVYSLGKKKYNLTQTYFNVLSSAVNLNIYMENGNIIDVSEPLIQRQSKTEKGVIRQEVYYGVSIETKNRTMPMFLLSKTAHKPAILEVALKGYFMKEGDLYDYLISMGALPGIIDQMDCKEEKGVSIYPIYLLALIEEKELMMHV